MIRMGDSEITAEGKRRAGRPKVRWNDDINNGMRRQVLEIGG
jgi:hypothetical protein